MFSELVFDKKGKSTEIAKIKGGRLDGEILRVKDRKSGSNVGTELILDKSSLVQPLYAHFDGNPSRLLIAGPSLCGKSYFAGMIAQDYKKRFPKNRIIVFSCVKEDKNLDKLKPLRIKCDDKLVDDPINLKELKNSLCIFDDIDSFGDKTISKALNKLRDNIMSTGRHENISVITTTQLLLDGDRTKGSITNAFQIVIFPHGGGKYHAIELLKRYMGLDKKQIDKIINLPSRWILINRVCPLYVLSEHSVFLL